jgi:rare lipoprotein A
MTGLQCATLAGLAALLCASAGCTAGPTPTATTNTADTVTVTAAGRQPDPRVLEAEELAQLPPVRPGSRIDHSGRKQEGKASYYAEHFANRKMADGRRFNPNADVAASKTLPLGTTAKVTNVQNGKSMMVKVEDRGPFVDGRVVDLAPKVADQLDIKKQGVAPVIVAPVAVPLPDGSVKLGAGAAGASPEELQKATELTAPPATR